LGIIIITNLSSVYCHPYHTTILAQLLHTAQQSWLGSFIPHNNLGSARSYHSTILAWLIHSTQQSWLSYARLIVNNNNATNNVLHFYYFWNWSRTL